MTTVFPGAIDALPRPAPTTHRDAGGGLNLSTVVDNISDAIEAIEAKVGVSASTPTAAKVLTATGTGTSAWAQVVAAMIAANTISEAAIAAGSSGVQTTTSGAYADLANMSVTLTCEAGDQLIALHMGAYQHSVTAGAIVVALKHNANAEAFDLAVNEPVATYSVPFGTIGLFSATAGSNTVKVRWLTGAATATSNGNNRYLLVIRLRR